MGIRTEKKKNLKKILLKLLVLHENEKAGLGVIISCDATNGRFRNVVLSAKEG